MNSYEKRIFSVGLVLVIVLSLFFAQTTFGTRIDYVIGDQITDTHIRDEVTVVGIDDASLQKIGAWPWKRDVFAQLLETLNKQGARLVVFDILFLEERDGDAAMKKMLAESKIPVIFASKLDKDSNLILPVYSDSKYFNHGVAHVYPDDDGKVRVIPFFQKDSRGECHKSLAYQAFITYSKKDMDPCETSLHAFLFQDISPTTLSFIDVIEGRIPDPVIKDKIIFIGSNSLDIEDHFIGRSGEKIPGIYVHASIFTTLLNNSFLQPTSILTYIISVLIFLTGILLIIFRLKNIFLQGFLLLMGALALVVLSLLGRSLHYEISLSLLLVPYTLCSLYMIMFRYASTEKRNSYIKELFGRYVHPKVLAHILSSNNLKLGGEKKYITILFSDIRGFTTMTENMSPEELVETLNAYLETMSPIIMNHGGVIDKYIGDAIMAFWNAPVDIGNHEEKAVRSSLEMIEALVTIQKDTPLQIGIGLHAGEAIVGNIGSRARINYTIIGDAVNACSRLEGLTKKYGLQIIVSEQIKQAIIADDIMWRSIDRVCVKGKSEVMNLYEPMMKTKENEHLVGISNEAFALYLAGDFRRSYDLYKTINDMYSTKMRARIEGFFDHPPLSWDGIWVWDEK